MPNFPHNPPPPFRGAPAFDNLHRVLPRLIGAALLLLVLFTLGSSSTYVIEPGTRGIKITLGKAEDKFLPQGFGFKAPFISRIMPVNIRQRTQSVQAACFSSDLQQVTAELRVLYRVPEESVVQIFRQYSGDPFDTLIAPRVQEAIKEVTALQTAEMIVKNREEIKEKTLTAAREKIGNILWVEDIVIRNLDLSKELEQAIEAKMVAEQQAAQARFSQMQAKVEAETAVIRAKGDAEAIKVRGDALKLNPAYLRLQIVERWNGRSPLVVPTGGNNTGVGLLLPLGEAQPETVSPP